MPTAPRSPLLVLCLTLACDAARPPEVTADPVTVPADPAPAAVTAPENRGVHPFAALGLLALAPAPAPRMYPQKKRPPPRFIAVVDKPDTAPCPVPPNREWQAAPLFHSDVWTKHVKGLPKPLKPPRLLPAIFERFCVYTAIGSQTTLTIEDFGAGVTITRLDADPDILIPQSVNSSNVRRHLADTYAKALQSVDVDGFGPANPYTPPVLLEAPRIAVVDTMDFLPAAQPIAFDPAKKRQRHGISMSEILGDVRCRNGDTACRGRSFFAQAFPRGNDDDLALGGAGSLAAAILESLVRWRIDDGADASTPLVLNLSVGWDAAVYGDLPPALSAVDHEVLLDVTDASVPAPTRAVHAALVYASCLDALAVAAAGNNLGAPCEQKGPLAPASWERHAAPTRAVCNKLFPGSLNQPRIQQDSIVPTRQALVYAAGGIQADGRPLANMRPGSTPRRVLPALHAVAGAGPLLTEAWSGTSVAAAALSGLAAALWSYNPKLSPHQVLALIDASGTELPDLAAELVPGQGNARRIHAHAAFEQLRAWLPPFSFRPQNPFAPSGSFSPFYSALELAIAGLPIRQPVSTESRCRTSTIQCGTRSIQLHRCSLHRAPPLAAAPLRRPPGPVVLPGAPAPWLRPQPDSPICSICPIKGGKLTLSLNPNVAVDKADLSMLTLDLHGADATVSITLPDISITGDIRLSLDYKVTLGAETTSLERLLKSADNPYKTGVLSYFVPDAVGQLTRMTSAISFLQ